MKKKLFFYIPFWAFLFVGFGSVILSQAERRDKFLAEQRLLASELDALKKTAEELNDQIRFHSEDYYIEKTARERLGLVYPDEYIFIAD